MLKKSVVNFGFRCTSKLFEMMMVICIDMLHSIRKASDGSMIIAFVINSIIIGA